MQCTGTKCPIRKECIKKLGDEVPDCSSGFAEKNPYLIAMEIYKKWANQEIKIGREASFIWWCESKIV